MLMGRDPAVVTKLAPTYPSISMCAIGLAFGEKSNKPLGISYVSLEVKVILLNKELNV